MFCECKYGSGELLLEDCPIVFGPKSNVTEPVCVECLANVESRQSICSQCRMPLCRKCNNEKCRHHSDHECSMLKKFLEGSGSDGWTEDQKVLILRSLTPLRLFLVQNDDASIRKRLDFLMDHLSERTQARITPHFNEDVT